jgi:hypothetical protein
MKLVVDNDSNVRVLPVTDYRDMAAMARGFADMLEQGKIQGARAASLVLVTDEQVLLDQWGECLSKCEWVGALESAKLQIALGLPDE